MRQYELVERVKRYNPNADEALLNRAYVYAMKAHGAQKRASGDPYMSHPLEVAAITTDALLDVFYGVKSAYALNGSWLMNRKTMRVVRGLRDSDGNLLWQSGLQAGQPGLLLGKPVYECDTMPDAADEATPIVFGDFDRGYLITDRIAFEPHVDYDTRFGEDIVVFGGRRRVGGKVVMGEALIKLKIAA